MVFYFYCMAALMIIGGVCYFLNRNRGNGQGPAIPEDEGNFIFFLKMKNFVTLKISLKIF